MLGVSCGVEGLTCLCCAAEQELADIRVWRAMLQASSMNGGAASLADTLQRMIEVASNRVGAVFGAAKAPPPEGQSHAYMTPPCHVLHLCT